MVLGDRGIQLLGDRIDDVRILDRQNDGLSEIMVTFNMCRNANLMDNLRHHQFQVRLLALPHHGNHIGRGVPHPCQLNHAFNEDFRIKGLEEIVAGAGAHHLPLKPRIIEARHDHKLRRILGIVLKYLVHHRDGIHMGEKNITQNHVRMLPANRLNQLLSILRNRHRLNPITPEQLRAQFAELCIIICN